MYNLCCNYRKCMLWILELALICCLTMRHFFQKYFPSEEPGNFRELLKDVPSNAAGRQDKKSTFFQASDGCVVGKQPLPTGNNRHSSLASSSPVERFRKQLSLSLTSLVELNKPEAFHPSEVDKVCAISTSAENEGATVSKSTEKGDHQSSQPPVRDEGVMLVESVDSAKSPMTSVKENTVVSSQTPDKDDPVMEAESQVTGNKTESSKTSGRDDVSTSIHTFGEANSSTVIQTSVEYKSVSPLQTLVEDDSALSIQTPFKDDPNKTLQKSSSFNDFVEVDLALSSQTPVEEDLVTPADDDPYTLSQAADDDDFESQSQTPEGDLDISSQMPVEGNHNLVTRTPPDGESPMPSSNNDDAAVPSYPAPAEGNQTTTSQPPTKEDTMTSSQLYAKNDSIGMPQSSVWKAQEKPYALNEKEFNPYSQYSAKEDDSSSVDNRQALQSDANHIDKTMGHFDVENTEITSSQTFPLKMSSQESPADDWQESKSEPLLDRHDRTSQLSYDECWWSRSSDSEAKDTALQATNDNPKKESSTTTAPHICIVVDVDEPPEFCSEDNQDLKIAQLWNHSCDV